MDALHEVSNVCLVFLAASKVVASIRKSVFIVKTGTGI